MNKIKTILLLLLLLINTVSAQNQDSSSVTEIFAGDFRAGIGDAKSFVTLPFSSSESSWLKAAAAAGITASLFLADNTVRNFAGRNQNTFTDDLTKAGNYYGNGVVPLVLSAGLYSTGLAAGNAELRNTGRVLFESLAAAGITVSIIKVIAGRSRPYMENGNAFFKPFNFNNDFNSFPSGHTIVAFTTSTVLAGRIKNIYASIGLYGLAVLTVYQRIYSDNHWLSDTFLGAALGYGIGRFFLAINESEDSVSNQNFSLSVFPSVLNSQPALSIAVKFR